MEITVLLFKVKSHQVVRRLFFWGGGVLELVGRIGRCAFQSGTSGLRGSELHLIVLPCSLRGQHNYVINCVKFISRVLLIDSNLDLERFYILLYYLSA